MLNEVGGWVQKHRFDKVYHRNNNQSLTNQFIFQGGSRQTGDKKKEDEKRRWADDVNDECIPYRWQRQRWKETCTSCAAAKAHWLRAQSHICALTHARMLAHLVVHLLGAVKHIDHDAQGSAQVLGCFRLPCACGACRRSAHGQVEGLGQGDVASEKQARCMHHWWGISFYFLLFFHPQRLDFTHWRPFSCAFVTLHLWQQVSSGD